MMATEFCPQCHQRLAGELVAGVRLSHFKAQMFHFVESQPGHSALELAQHFDKNTHTIRAHLFQINDALSDAGLRIQGDKFTGYYIKKV